MITPEYLNNPPERERVLVEHSTKHTVVLKPGFYNRRNQSKYLKNAFPAGFQIKSKLTERLGSTIVKEGSYVNPYGSFTEWTKGESETMGDSISADLTDPYADVAGPYLAEILANRPTEIKKGADVNKHTSIIARELPLHNHSEKTRKPTARANSPSKVQVYNAPTLLPTFTPALTQGKVANNLAPAPANSYDAWLAFQRSEVPEKYWFIKGNVSDHNYSAHDFTGERATASQLLHQANLAAEHSLSPPPSPPALGFATESQFDALRGASATIITELPKPLPARITVEVHTWNQMLRTSTLADERPIVRSIDSSLSLAELKALITEDIITGIETAFKLHVSATTRKGSSRLDYSKVELSFQCFSPYAHAWRPVASEVDWVQAKQNCRDEQDALRVMYALEKKSEFILLKEIQSSYQRQKNAEKDRGTPQISLKALTESLERDLRIKKKYNFTDSPPPTSPTRLSSAQGGVSRQASRGASRGGRTKRATSPYPNPRPLLQSFVSQSSSSLPLPSPTLPALPQHCFFPLGHSMTGLTAQSSGRNSGVSTPHALAGSPRKPGRLLDSLTRTNSGAALGAGHGTPEGLQQLSTGSTNARSLLANVGAVTLGGGAGTQRGTATAPNTATSAAPGGKSIFYPKRSESLDKMYEQLESSIPRQQDFASNLEQRLFKTKW